METEYTITITHQFKGSGGRTNVVAGEQCVIKMETFNQGQWLEGKKHGQGVMMTSSNVNGYDGNWKDDKRSGYRSFYNLNKDLIYESN